MQLKHFVVYFVASLAVLPTVFTATLGPTCCVNCTYKTSCCCPPRRPVKFATKTHKRTVWKTLTTGCHSLPTNQVIQKSFDIPSTWDNDTHHDLFKRHLCPPCTLATKGVCCLPPILKTKTKTQTITITKRQCIKTTSIKRKTTKNVLPTTVHPFTTNATASRTPAQLTIGQTPTLTTNNPVQTTLLPVIKTTTTNVPLLKSTTPVYPTSTLFTTTTPLPVVIYNSLPSVIPGNVASQGFQCCQTSEFGDQIQFAGTLRKLVKADVMLSVWAIKSTYPLVGDASGWDQSITLNIYAVGPNDGNGNPTLGTLLGSVASTFHIPWRPEPDSTNCPTKSSPGYDYKYQSTPGPVDTNCFNGLATTITFDLTGLSLVAPDQIVWGAAFDTQSYGLNPTGTPGPYNSLNIGAEGFGASIGTDVAPTVAWINTKFGGFYCDNGAGGTGTFRPDVGCTSGNDWNGYTPQIKIYAL